MAIEDMATLRIPTDGRSMLEATRRVSVYTIPGRTITLVAGIMRRLVEAMGAALAAVGTWEVSAVVTAAVATAAVATAAAGIAERNYSSSLFLTAFAGWHQNATAERGALYTFL
jgi:hypothetical protein